jgi:outer membrane receptor protein involved in Fe transport
MKRFSILVFLLALSSACFSQGSIKGTVKDDATGETIVGAVVIARESKTAVTDIDGNFSIALDSGVYNVTISYIGYEPSAQRVRVGSKPVTLVVSMKTKTLNEVEIVADVARARETPVAFSNVGQKQIREELGTRDLPMVLNTTPGVYATEQGGGSGDARVTIRGFDQRNVAVMVDGVPVNDMENGQVYWSNWDGLSDITRTMQVQRGLGASKLAIASVGGTINIITQGIDQKMSLGITQQVNDYGLYKTSFGFNSGQLKGNWGITLGGSRKWGNNWVDGTFTDAYSYFFKVQKRFDKHLFSLSANGAPQKHGQRTDRLPVAIYSRELSDKLGINTDSILTAFNQVERGLRYNPNYGILPDNYEITYRGNPFPSVGNENHFNERVNFYHKPQFNLAHFWNPNEKLNVSTVFYVSLGKGGGTAVKNTLARDKATGLLIVEPAYIINMNAPPAVNYSATERPATNYMRSSNNDHAWYGILSSWTYRVDSSLNLLFGVDGRYYKGSHYQTVYDLMGADYAIDASSDRNQVNGTKPGDPNFQNAVRRVGDKVTYYNDAFVMWAGAFAQAEYKIKKWTTFLTASASETGYQRVDYYKKKDLVIDGEVFEQAVGTGDAFFYNGTSSLTALAGQTITTSGDTTFVGSRYIVNATRYTNQSAEARTATTDRKWFFGYTIKGGANYNINDHMNAFANLGYLDMAPRMNVVFDNNNREVLDVKNQKVSAVELGYGLHYQKFAANLNLYYTAWKNKPPSTLPSVNTPDGTFYYNINGLDARHMGAEVDFTVKLLKNLSFDGAISFGDWITTSSNQALITNEDGDIVDTVDFSAKGVHVGDAAQTQLVGSLRYDVIPGLYIKPRYTFFSRNYANFDPTGLVNNNKDRESWRMPDYGILDLFAGYERKVWKLKVTVTAGVNNLLDNVYISDAQNGTRFDASSALVYMGMGRRISGSLRIEF